ncbi:hypothetical protein GIB67_023708 [Kingdonia uniflora]|uniref:Phospholipase D C-terminal domain-containing protein n=1 Tax=Kingdonia uniflora TaxID=39325 RepID=A0A7J7MGD3_9MAGN|nr:hypothetical protein GIB67_023708 [Kingdonia uniflora]
MSLWAEHTGFLKDIFTVPKSLECVRRVRSLGESNWRQFAAEDVSEMSGDLLKYPLEVDPRGKVKLIPGCKSFPDVGGTIVGQSGGLDTKRNQLPCLVYVFREKRPGHNHHKKAGAINALINMKGLDGIQGPIYVGTGCIFQRHALYGFDAPKTKKPHLLRTCNCLPK